MSFKNKTNQKFISAILVLAILAPAVLFLSTPKQANAQLGCGNTPGNPCFTVQQHDVAPVSWLTKFFTGATSVSTAESAAFDAKQWAAELIRQILRAFARRLLAQMTDATVTWINTGFHGAPLFLERPDSFFKDIAKFEIRDLVNIIGYDSNRFPFGKAFALNIIDSYKQTLATNAQYSLSKVINDPVLLNNFRNDFSVGGWNGFLLNTQYPQNNYIGSQMLYSNELASRLAGNPVSNNITKVQDTLQKGMGFLSPQTCPSNPRYNNLQNEFHVNSFKCSIKPPDNLTDCSKLPTDSAEKRNCDVANSFELDKYKTACDFQKKEEWDPANTCPGDLVNTTPGSVVWSHISEAINLPFKDTLQSVGLGNSISAIFDALLNKFLSSGLNALTSRENTHPPADSFDYYGHTLGSPNPSTGSGGGLDWGGPDQVIILGDLKQSLQNLIDNGNKELKLIDSNDPNIPGIIQMLNIIFPKTQELDMCLPGPNIGWQERMDFDVQRAGAELQGKTSDPDSAKANAATEAYGELIFATNSFKEWVGNKINNELVSSVDYLSAVDSVKEASRKWNEVNDRKNVISETLIKLTAIKAQLDGITTQPAPGSTEESTMIRLKQRLDGMIIELSTNSTVNEMQNNLDDTVDKFTNLNRLITKCSGERQAKGWSVPGGATSLFSGSTEQALFCSLPIAGGYSHKSFINNGVVAYPQIPLVNATNVYPPPGIVDTPINIALNCDAIYRTSITDYKKSTPGS